MLLRECPARGYLGSLQSRELPRFWECGLRVSRAAGSSQQPPRGAVLLRLCGTSWEPSRLRTPPPVCCANCMQRTLHVVRPFLLMCVLFDFSFFFCLAILKFTCTVSTYTWLLSSRKAPRESPERSLLLRKLLFFFFLSFSRCALECDEPFSRGPVGVVPPCRSVAPARRAGCFRAALGLQRWHLNCHQNRTSLRTKCTLHD